MQILSRVVKKSQSFHKYNTKVKNKILLDDISTVYDPGECSLDGDSVSISSADTSGEVRLTRFHGQRNQSSFALNGDEFTLKKKRTENQ